MILDTQHPGLTRANPAGALAGPPREARNNRSLVAGQNHFHALVDDTTRAQQQDYPLARSNWSTTPGASNESTTIQLPFCGFGYQSGSLEFAGSSMTKGGTCTRRTQHMLHSIMIAPSHIPTNAWPKTNVQCDVIHP
jgi:hypothetical protein